MNKMKSVKNLSIKAGTQCLNGSYYILAIKENLVK
jgi:hypothetical protein